MRAMTFSIGIVELGPQSSNVCSFRSPSNPKLHGKIFRRIDYKLLRLSIQMSSSADAPNIASMAKLS